MLSRVATNWVQAAQLTVSTDDLTRKLANASSGSQGGARGAGTGSAGSDPASGDPVAGVSLFQALEKQLGLKLEKHQRPEPVFVIDHLEGKPTEN
ncbi:MAG TPA: TIGR03435 family protein [Chroococcales cyanobacterium]